MLSISHVRSGTETEVDFAGPARVLHVPTMAGERSDNPGYEIMGRLYAIGNMLGLTEGVAKDYPA